jgi:hypothetical protein
VAVWSRSGLHQSLKTKCPPLVTATPLHTSGEENKKMKRVGDKNVDEEKKEKEKC